MKRRFERKNRQNDRVYLHRLVALTKARKRLHTHPGITLGGCDYDIQVLTGIDALAAAAGKKLTVERRGSDEFPWQLQFYHQGITFFQLKSAAEMTAGDPNDREMQAFFLQ